MSRRARRVRSFATALSRASGTPVIARWHRGWKGYVVQWQGGPDEQAMVETARSFTEDFPDLDLDVLGWLRGG